MVEYDPQEEQLVRRLDSRLIPCLALLYLAGLLDRVTHFEVRQTDYATHAGIVKDLNIGDHGVVMAYVAFGIASFVCVLPVSLMFRKLGPARCLGGMSIAWGFVTACTAAVQDFPGLATTKVFLGAMQCGFLPGLLLYIVSFYTREEWATRLSWVVTSAMITIAFLGVFSDFGTKVEGAKGLPTWRWMLLCDGAVSIVAGLIAWIFLPSYPQTCMFLTPADRVLAIARGRDGGDPAHDSDDESSSRRRSVSLPHAKAPRVRFDIGQLIEALTDQRNWLFAVAYLFAAVVLNVLVTLGPEVAATSFAMDSRALDSYLDDPDAASEVIDNAVTGTRHARIVSALPHLLGGIVSYFCAWNSDRTGDRALHATIPLMVSSVGFAVLALMPVNVAGGGAVRYFLGLVPATAGVVASFPCLLSYALDRPQGDTNRATVAGLTFSFGQSFSPVLASPGSLLLSDASSVSVHALGAGMCACGAASSALCLLLIRWLYRREEAQLWGKGPGLRRLLNDADEGQAWDVELSQGDIFAEPSKKAGGGKPKRKMSRGAFWSDKPSADSDWDLKVYANVGAEES